MCLLREALSDQLAAGGQGRGEQRRREAAKEAVTAERVRLAQELHDVVSNNVGMIAVQAGAADVLLDRDPERTRESLRAIEGAVAAAGSICLRMRARQGHMTRWSARLWSSILLATLFVTAAVGGNLRN